MRRAARFYHYFELEGGAARGGRRADGRPGAGRGARARCWTTPGHAGRPMRLAGVFYGPGAAGSASGPDLLLAVMDAWTCRTGTRSSARSSGASVADSRSTPVLAGIIRQGSRRRDGGCAVRSARRRRPASSCPMILGAGRGGDGAVPGAARRARIPFDEAVAPALSRVPRLRANGSSGSRPGSLPVADAIRSCSQWFG